jgi:molecular chaperone GrpE
MEQDAEKLKNDAQMQDKDLNQENLSSVANEPQESPDDRYEELNNRFLRLAADFENYRKRTERDMTNRIALANEDFARDMLEVADNFERALKDEKEAAREGIGKINKLFDSILARHGLIAIESLGTRFSPLEHEAIACIPADKPEGTVIEEVSKGYSLNGKVIRCAKVVVSKGSEEV